MHSAYSNHFIKLLFTLTWYYNQGYSEEATAAVQGWIKSTGHRQNMEGNFNLTGIGVATNAKGQYYFTQMFIRSR